MTPYTPKRQKFAEYVTPCRDFLIFFIGHKKSRPAVKRHGDKKEASVVKRNKSHSKRPTLDRISKDIIMFLNSQILSSIFFV